MKSLKEKFQRFMSDDNGMEFIAIAVIVAGAILLAGIAVTLYSNAKGALDAANKEIPMPQ